MSFHRGALAALVPFLAVTAAHAFLGRLPFIASPDEPFADAQLVNGVQATQADCAKARDAVWAQVGAEGECLRYWHAGLAGQSTALVYFGGDLLAGNAVLDRNYPQRSPRTMQALADETAQSRGVPYIFLARPGMLGSSGDHKERRRALESQLISAALDRIKERHALTRISIAGQSGGGHVVASLLTLRSDIDCAVAASAVSAPKARWTVRGWTRDSTGYADSYEPLDHLPAALPAGLRVFVLGDPRDANVPWQTQLPLAAKLKERGGAVEVLEGEGAGTERHGLSRSAHLVAAQCMKGVSAPAILELGRQGLKG